MTHYRDHRDSARFYRRLHGPRLALTTPSWPPGESDVFRADFGEWLGDETGLFVDHVRSHPDRGVVSAQVRVEDAAIIRRAGALIVAWQEVGESPLPPNVGMMMHMDTAAMYRKPILTQFPLDVVAPAYMPPEGLNIIVMGTDFSKITAELGVN